MSEEQESKSQDLLHCAICGRQLTPTDLRELQGGGLLLCGYCRAQEESCGCRDDADEE
jgi:hypothetical protein